MTYDIGTLPDELTVEVTQQHIDCGRRHSCGRCPLALALMDAYAPMHGWQYWSVGMAHASYFASALNYQEYELTDEATIFIKRFDAGRPVEPQTFTLRVVK